MSFAPLLAAALALSPMTSAPARAGDAETLAAALLGAGALFVIVDGLDGKTHRAKPHHAARRPDPHRHFAPSRQLRNDHRHGPRRWDPHHSRSWHDARR